MREVVGGDRPLDRTQVLAQDLDPVVHLAECGEEHVLVEVGAVAAGGQVVDGQVQRLGRGDDRVDEHVLFVAEQEAAAAGADRVARGVAVHGVAGDLVGDGGQA